MIDVLKTNKMIKSILTILFLSTLHSVICQRDINCSELLSQAEQAYREGRFDEIKKLGDCLGVRKRNSNDELYPHWMKELVNELKHLEDSSEQDLGHFSDFSSELKDSARYRSLKRDLVRQMEGQNLSRDTIRNCQTGCR